MATPLITVENVSKKFCKCLKHSLVYGAQDLFHEITGFPKKHNGMLRQAEFWAVRDVSFEVKRGECLGLIGHNGAGKTTLLRMLNGLIKPDAGRIVLDGKVGALITIGAGFHPVLTGKENVFIAGAVLGLSRAEIQRKYDSIVSFAELEEFMNMPVKNYSSGMYVRLGFAIAMHCDPDILLIDEILSVGDAGFKSKCFNAMSEMMKNTAVILVSHNMQDMARVCQKGIVFDHGQMCYNGSDIEHAIVTYLNKVSHTVPEGYRSGLAGVDNILVVTDETIKTNKIAHGKSCKIILDCWVSFLNKPIAININLFSTENFIVSQSSNILDDCEITPATEKFSVEFTLDKIKLKPGKFYIDVVISTGNLDKVLYRQKDVASILITGSIRGYAPVIFNGAWKIKNQKVTGHSPLTEQACRH